MAGGNRQITAAEIPADAGVDEAISRFAPMYCPHCNMRARARTSKQISGHHREIYYQCVNLFCGHTFRATLGYDYGIVPSNIPNPKIDLPMRAVVRQDVIEAMRPRDDTQPDMFDLGSTAAEAA